MTKHTRVSASPDVYADISINKNRVRKHGKRVYLKDGTEFQIEFNNTSTHSYLARIKINGNEIHRRLVIRPGEHVYLERYLDSPRKFKFNTYEIPDTRAAAKAIRENGLIEIDFYKEAILYPSNRFTTWTEYRHWPTYDWYRDPNPYKWVYRPTTTHDGTGITCTDSSSSNDNTPDIHIDSSVYDSSSGTPTFDVSTQAMHFMESSPAIQQRAHISEVSSKKETGRVERGNTSRQNLQTIDMDFENIIAKTVEFHLYPISEKKHYTSRDLRNYCKCGRTQKRGWEFCPGCGKELR